MTPAELTHLRRAFGEICRGYSEVTWDGKPIYVAHLTTFDQTEIDILQEEATHAAVARGVKTEADRLKWLEDKGIWTKKDERALNDQRLYVEGLKTTRSKFFIKAQIDAMDKQLNEEFGKLNQLANKRAGAIGLTAEHVAERRVQLEYIRASFCQDRALEVPLFDEHSMNELDEDESDELLGTYISTITRFTTDTIRRMAVQPFFVNQFYLCGERVFDFFNVPIVDLTIYQANLLSFGQYYRNIFTHHQIPKEFMLDPDKIEEFVTRSTNAKKVMDKIGAEGGRTGVVGAASEDFKMMGVEDGTKDMQNVAAKGYKDARSAANDVGYTVINK